MPGQIEDKSKRSFLYLSAGALGAVGTAFAAWPLIDSMNPDANLKLYDARIDLDRIEEGESWTVFAAENLVFIRHRTRWEIEAAKNVELSDLKDPQSDAERVVDPSWLVVVGLCTLRNCILHGQKPGYYRGDFDGWVCPCCGSDYDTSGRIRRGPAPRNLAIPPYDFLNETTLGLRRVPKPPAWPS